MRNLLVTIYTIVALVLASLPSVPVYVAEDSTRESNSVSMEIEAPENAREPGGADVIDEDAGIAEEANHNPDEIPGEDLNADDDPEPNPDVNLNESSGEDKGFDNANAEEESVDTPEVLQVTLPTNGTLDFILDPQGICAMNVGEGVPLSELDGGKIYPRSEMPATLINESSMPIALTVTLYAYSTDADGAVTEEISFIGKDSYGSIEQAKPDVFDGDNLNVLLYAVPSAIAVKSEQDEFVPADMGFVISREPVTMTYILPGAVYTDDGSGSFSLVPGTGSGIQFRIGGYINSGADWSGFTDNDGMAPGDICVSAVFDYSTVNDDLNEYLEPVDDAAYMYLPPSGSQSPCYVKLSGDARETIAAPTLSSYGY